MRGQQYWIKLPVPLRFLLAGGVGLAIGSSLHGMTTQGRVPSSAQTKITDNDILEEFKA